jgi:Bacterial RNA polymerase, alpha chain C terminal domain
MKKTIEQILNETIVGESIITIINKTPKVGIIKSVKVNARDTSSFGCLTLEVEGVLMKHYIGSGRHTEIDFSNVSISSKLEYNLDTNINDIPELSVRAYNVLRSNNLNFIKDIVEFKKTNDNFSGMRNVGNKFRSEMDFLLKGLVKS